MATKRKTAQPWWGKRRVQRRLMILGSLALVVSVFAWLVVRGEGGGSGSGEFLREPAPPFTLPTVAEGQGGPGVAARSRRPPRPVSLLQRGQGRGALLRRDCRWGGGLGQVRGPECG